VGEGFRWSSQEQPYHLVCCSLILTTTLSGVFADKETDVERGAKLKRCRIDRREVSSLPAKELFWRCGPAERDPSKRAGAPNHLQTYRRWVEKSQKGH
jgi:hypothetical protein